MPQEHVPLGAYGLLRRIVGLGPQRVPPRTRMGGCACPLPDAAKAGPRE